MPRNKFDLSCEDIYKDFCLDQIKFIILISFNNNQLKFYNLIAFIFVRQIK